jgi:hypothetical protein
MEAVLKEIVHIMHHDYAGWKDKTGWDDPADFLKKMQETKVYNPESFTQLVKEYLLDFKDRHIIFKNLKTTERNPKNRRFKVRRYENRLYITEVTEEQGVKKGWSIASLGGYTIPELKEKHSRLLDENHPERENWSPILSLYDFGEMEDEDGEINKGLFAFYEEAEYTPEYRVKQLNEKTLLMNMTDFINPDAILDMAEKNQAIL